MWTLFSALIFASGFAACWMSKDAVTRLVTGSEAFVKSLEGKIAALKEKL